MTIEDALIRESIEYWEYEIVDDKLKHNVRIISLLKLLKVSIMLVDSIEVDEYCLSKMLNLLAANGRGFVQLGN